MSWTQLERIRRSFWYCHVTSVETWGEDCTRRLLAFRFRSVETKDSLYTYTYYACKLALSVFVHVLCRTVRVCMYVCMYIVYIYLYIYNVYIWVAVACRTPPMVDPPLLVPGRTPPLMLQDDQKIANPWICNDNQWQSKEIIEKSLKINEIDEESIAMLTVRLQQDEQSVQQQHRSSDS